MNRRRFLSLAAAFACAPARGRADTWSGQALGADVSVTLHGPRDRTRAALAAIPRLLDGIEQRFSLYRADSAVSRLNRTGQLTAPDAQMRRLLGQADRAHRLTGGVFDPTVQPLWQALAHGRDTQRARAAIGWDRVQWSDVAVTLDAGQALTFNGIAQGFATDLIRAHLLRHGAEMALIDLGEYAALGGPFTVGLHDPVQGHLGTRALRNSAIATSSPDALRLGSEGHILHPNGTPPLWSTVSIEATSATLADALSTAAVFLDAPELRRLRSEARLVRITTVDTAGNIRTF